jgi:hypothetical protein
MKRVAFVHLGDIHYPETNDPFAAIDLKDPGFPAGVAATIAAPALQSVLRQVTRLMRERPDELLGMLLVGDLTTHARLPEYHACVEDLVGLLSSFPAFQPNSARCVPGNHDVDRALANKDPITSKFDSLDNVWIGAGYPIQDSTNVKPLMLGSASEIAVYPLNSCIGCGEHRLFPGDLRTELAAAIEALRAAKGDSHADALLRENLDTPSFLADQIDTVVREIEILPSTSVPVLLAHHPIFPQGTPRVSPYTEAINAGWLRKQLAAAGRTLLYCHGHIHDNPVEVLWSPTQRKPTLIAIGAPRLDCGFNYVELQYGSDGSPWGVEVVRYEVRDLGVQPLEAVRIPLIRFGSDDELASDEIAVLKSLDASYQYAGRVAWRTTSSFEEISDCLLKLEWLGLCEVLNRTKDSGRWHVRALLT